MLPNKKVEVILTELQQLGRKRNVLLQHYQKHLGKLRHAAISISMCIYLFTPLYQALKNNPKLVYLNKEIKLRLRNWRLLIKIATKNPVHIRQLMPKIPEF